MARLTVSSVLSKGQFPLAMLANSFQPPLCRLPHLLAAVSDMLAYAAQLLHRQSRGGLIGHALTRDAKTLNGWTKVHNLGNRIGTGLLVQMRQPGAA